LKNQADFYFAILAILFHCYVPPIPIKKSPVTTVTTIDVFQLKILEKCQRINVNWYSFVENIINIIRLVSLCIL